LAASANRKLAWIPVQADAPDGCGLRTAPGTRDSTISRQVPRLYAASGITGFCSWKPFDMQVTLAA
jgi:hypothetical protein